MYIWESKNWQDFKWDSESVMPLLLKARQKQGILLGKIKMLGFEPEMKMFSDYLENEAINTSEIEGEHLNRDSVRSSAAKKLGLSKSTADVRYAKVENLLDILIDACSCYNKNLSEDKLHGWQAALFPDGYSGIFKINVGTYRGNTPMQVVSGVLGKEKVHYEAPPRKILEKEMQKFFKWFNAKTETDGIIKAAIAHLWFVIIHPYDDGNGRLARAITDMALAKDEQLKARYYSLSRQILQQRKEYYSVLEQTTKQNENDITKWLCWFLKIYISAIENSEIVINRVCAKNTFWQKFSNTDLSLNEKKVINKLLDSGEGNFEGGLTRKKYMSITKVSSATATRDLSSMLRLGILKELPGSGRSSAYDLNWNIFS